jgi:D-xylose transport system permease protein
MLASVGIVALLAYNRRQRQKYGFSQRPLWVDIALGALGVTVVLGGIAHLNRYPLPQSDVARGIAIPVLLTIVVAISMNFIATRRPFGRYVFAIGGNPEAAELGGINTRWIIVKTFMLMGVLVAIAAAVQTARLNAAVSGLGTLSELYVIAAAVIGGTSLSGGVGTIPGAVLGAVVMQSLQSGMVLVGVDAALQDVVVGIVLVAAVATDSIYRRRAA